MATLSQLGVIKCIYMLLVYSMDISFEEDERTLTMILYMVAVLSVADPMRMKM